MIVVIDPSKSKFPERNAIAIGNSCSNEGAPLTFSRVAAFLKETFQSSSPSVSSSVRSCNSLGINSELTKTEEHGHTLSESASCSKGTIIEFREVECCLED